MVTSPDSGPRVASGQKWSLESPESVCGEHSYTASVGIADCPGDLGRFRNRSASPERNRTKDAPGSSSFTRDQLRGSSLGVDQ